MDGARWLLDRGLAILSEHPMLALVPLVTALVAVDNVQRVADFQGMHAGVTFPKPAPILDVWTFVNVPQTGVSGPSAVPRTLLPVYAVVRGVLAAGYLGGIHDALDDRRLAFLANVREYGVTLVGYELLQLGAVVALVPLARLSPLVLVPGIIVLFVAGYLFYGTPYLVVAAEDGLVDALRHSVSLADSAAYAGFFVATVAGGAVISVVATPVVVNLGLVGVLLGAVLAAPLAVVVNAAAMALFRSLTDAATRVERPAHRAEGR